jgi:hypothetical protein
MKVKCKSRMAFKIVINNELRTFSEGEIILLDQEDAERLSRVGHVSVVTEPELASVKIINKPKVSKKAVKDDNN